MGNVQPTVCWGDTESDPQRQVSPRPRTGAPHSCAPHPHCPSPPHPEHPQPNRQGLMMTPDLKEFPKSLLTS